MGKNYLSMSLSILQFCTGVDDGMFCLYYIVEHQFEITVEDVRGLSVFGSTVWGETDCFVQYHFPFQRLQQSSDTSEG